MLLAHLLFSPPSYISFKIVTIVTIYDTVTPNLTDQAHNAKQ